MHCRPAVHRHAARATARPMLRHSPHTPHAAHVGTSCNMHTNSERHACTHAAASAATATATPVFTHPLEDPDLQGPHKASGRGSAPARIARPRPAAARRASLGRRLPGSARLQQRHLSRRAADPIGSCSGRGACASRRAEANGKGIAFKFRDSIFAARRAGQRGGGRHGERGWRVRDGIVMGVSAAAALTHEPGQLLVEQQHHLREVVVEGRAPTVAVDAD